MAAADWTHLPGDLLQFISNKLPIYSDYVRFRAVCHKWRSSLPKAPRHLPPQPPWLLLPLSASSQSQSHRAFYDLSTGKIHHLELPEASRPDLRVGSSNGWLVTLDNSPAILLLNPLTKAQINLPPLSSFPNVVSFDNLEVDNEYAIRDVSGEIYRLSLRKMRDSFIKKLVLPSGPVNNDNFVAMAILSKTGDLAYCKKGDQSWTLISDVGLSCYDLTYYKEQFYALDGEGAIAVCDVNGPSPSVSDLSVVIPPTQHLFAVLCLVNLGDDELLIVARYLGAELEYYELDGPEMYFRTDGFGVFRMNWSGPQWEEVESLGDWMLFVGKNSAVSLSAYDVRRCLRNPEYLNPASFPFYGEFLEDCIYYSDDYREPNYDGAYGSDTGIYRLWDKKTLSLPRPCFAGTPYSLWVTPNPA
ncbi:F-box protein SKIP23-like [Corylus avellana]|uniref:F-box protein SKIP23-like n=1 Tax=Corylus avellana TaxID=13451 RepID=UPI00286C5737|nr:F-box protein SKIP23-like [Corylus avellana]